jgi:hypothetical protein
MGNSELNSTSTASTVMSVVSMTVPGHSYDSQGYGGGIGSASTRLRY